MVVDTSRTFSGLPSCILEVSVYIVVSLLKSGEAGFYLCGVVGFCDYRFLEAELSVFFLLLCLSG